MEKVRYQNRDSRLETSGKTIGFYEREFYCFSNFSSFAVKWKGKIWPTSEHAFQAAHFFKTAPALAKKIHKAKSAHEAYKLTGANRDKFPKNWPEMKVEVMEDIVRCKLKQNPYIMRKLIQTGNRYIIEDSPKDAFWGWGLKRSGRNELGRIWMRLRDEIKK